MEFLPIRIRGECVYAGFWKRLCAGAVDTIVIVPLNLLSLWLGGFDRILAIGIAIPASLLFAMYNVWFNARFGGTLGKLAVGIRVVKPNGTHIGWSEAWKRSAVDLVFAIIFLTFTVWALLQVNPEQYASMGLTRNELLKMHPWFSDRFIMLSDIWIWSEMLVLLFNHRKRAIHDFIANTIVVMKEFAEPHGTQESIAGIHAVDLP